MNRAHLLFALTLSAALLSACRGPDDVGPETASGPADARAGGPIILISIDTLRSDRLPAYGYEGVTTPSIDRLRSDGILFRSAWSHYPLTLPAHASMLTGLLPPEHGIRDNVGYRLDASHPSLPSQLAALGYRTGGFVSSYLLRSDSGLAEGFEVYDDDLARDPNAALGASQRPGTETFARARDWLDTLPAGTPYFLFLHLYEPHTPYTPPEPFASRFEDAYDGEIAAADAVVGQLLGALDARGEYGQATVVLTSDHGEGLGDHGEIEHGILLYRESLQVPMILKRSGNQGAGDTVDATAQLIDVAPTLRQIAGGSAGGTSLLDLDQGPNRTVYAETYYPRFHMGWSELLAGIDGGLYYIEGPDPELFDLAKDPAQRDNVLAERRRDFARLRAAVESHRQEPTAPAAVDPESAARLAALGYLKSSVGATDGPLPDPKANMHVLETLGRAFERVTKGDHPAAATAFRQVVEEHPQLTDAWENLGLALHRSGRLVDALEAYEEAMTLSGGTSHIALSTARVLLDLGRHEDAREHAALATATDPAAAELVLTTIALREDDVDQAESHALAAIAAQPDNLQALIFLAQIAIRREDFESGQRRLDEAHAIRARLHGKAVPLGLHLAQGEIFAHQGRAAEAEVAFVEETRHHPEDPRAYTRLAFLYSFAERPQDATLALRRLVEINPNPGAYAAAVEAMRALGDQDQAARLLAFARSQFPKAPRLEQLADG